MLRKMFAFGLVTSVCLAAASANAQTNVKAVYDAATGNIKFTGFRPAPGEVGLTFLGSSDAVLVRNNASTGGVAGVTLDNFTPGEVSWLNLAGWQGEFNAGNIVVPGTPLSALSLNVQVDFVTNVAGEVIIPEPASIGLAGVGLIGLAVRRRRAA